MIEISIQRPIKGENAFAESEEQMGTISQPLCIPTNGVFGPFLKEHNGAQAIG